LAAVRELTRLAELRAGIGDPQMISRDAPSR